MIVRKIIEKELIKGAHIRCDGSPFFEYPEISSFGVKTEKFSFYSGQNKLIGELAYVGEKKNKDLLIFIPGFGAGRKAYSLELSSFAKKGFLVLSFDGTGTMESQGESMVSLAQIIPDLDALFKYIESNEELKNRKRLVMGHSWGGFGAVHCLHHDEYKIEKIVNLSGFISLPNECIDLAPIVKKVKKSLIRALINLYGKECVIDGVDLLNKAKIPVLCIQGDKDNMVSYKHNFLRIVNEVHNPLVTTYTAKNKYHQPYWTLKAQDYFIANEKFDRINRPSGFKLDYSILFQDDQQIISLIIDFLKK